MAISCSFHPSQPAHFQCYDCDTTFCESCITVRKVETYGCVDSHYFCPACETEAALIGISNILPPFWKQLGRIFLYPLQPTPLIMTLLLSILGALMPSSWMVQLLVWVMMMKYAYSVLLATASGNLTAPKLTLGLMNSDVVPVFKQVAVFAILGWASSTIFLKVGPLGGVPFIALSALCMPVIIMLLVASNSIITALNPMLFFQVIFRIGYPYLLLYLFLTFLATAPYYLMSFFAPYASPPILKFLSLFLSQLYLLISYHLMGYVLLQYHNEIGYHVNYEYFLKHSRTKKKTKKISEKEQFNNCLGVLIKSGRYEKAIPLLKDKIAVESPDINLAEKYLQLLKLAGEKEKTANYTPIFLGHLVSSKKKIKAMNLLEEIRKKKLPTPSPEVILKVASWYEESGKYKLAMKSYSYCINNAKGHELAPEAYFKVARLFHEQGKNSSKAVKILRSIISSFPQSSFAGQAKKYLLSIQNAS